MLGRVLGLWLESKGLPVLHGGCLGFAKGAVGVLGKSGMGKSTLCMAGVKAGVRLISDDLIPLALDSGAWNVAPGLPQMRLWPDTGHHYFGNFEQFERVHPDYLKRKLTPDSRLGLAMACAPACLQAVVVLIRTEASQVGGFQWRRLYAADAMVQLIGQSYNVEILQALGWQKKRLSALAKLAEMVPVWELTYQSGFEKLANLIAGFHSRWGLS